MENETLEDLKLKEIKGYDKRRIQKIESFPPHKWEKRQIKNACLGQELFLFYIGDGEGVAWAQTQAFMPP